MSRSLTSALKRSVAVAHLDQGGIPSGDSSSWRTPGGIEHGFTAGPNGAVVYDVFAPPREEYKKGGSGFGMTSEREG